MKIKLNNKRSIEEKKVIDVNIKKSAKGITLIALVITIIVLLILAGVSIAMLTGENGILTNASNASTASVYNGAEEQVKLCFMSVKSEIMSRTVSDSSYDAGTAENTVKLGQLVEKDLNDTKYWSVNYSVAGTIGITYTNSAIKAGTIENGKPSQNGKIEYEIILTGQQATLKIDGTSIGETGSGNDESGTQTGSSVTELREGDEVIYTAGNGAEIPCIVLYDSTGSYGIQVISKDTVGSEIELGNATLDEAVSDDAMHFATAKTSYNTAISILNNAAQSYMNTNLSQSNGARCVGSSPSETPITIEENSGTYTNNKSYFSTYNNQFKPESDNNLESVNEDWIQMNKSNINNYNITKDYWIASRNVSAESVSTQFFVRNVDSEGYYGRKWICYIQSSGATCSHSISSGLRPVFILKSDIHFVENNGTKKLIQ